MSFQLVPDSVTLGLWMA